MSLEVIEMVPFISNDCTVTSCTHVGLLLPVWSGSFLMLVSHWRRRRGDVAATPATDQSRRLGRHQDDVSATDVFGSRGDVSMKSPTSHGDVSETSSKFLSRLQ